MRPVLCAPACVQAADAFSTAVACAEVLKLIWAAGDLVTLNAHVLILTKRRAQLKMVHNPPFLLVGGGEGAMPVWVPD